MTFARLSMWTMRRLANSEPLFFYFKLLAKESFIPDDRLRRCAGDLYEVWMGGIEQNVVFAALRD